MAAHAIFQPHELQLWKHHFAFFPRQVEQHKAPTVKVPRAVPAPLAAFEPIDGRFLAVHLPA